MGNQIHKKITKDRGACLIIGLCVCVLVFLCSPYSPIYQYCSKEDEICYKIMAKGLLNGKMPYRDLFDHKGPLTYFVYALGYIFSQNTDVGVMLVLAVINVATYITAYKALRLFYGEGKSLLTVSSFLVITGFSAANILSTMSKPENILLLPIMLSAYILLRKYRDAQISKEYLFSTKEIYIIGLLCGCVFAIKLNFCIYYLTFIGFYFLWLLIKKHFKKFILHAVLFLSGILTVSAPILIFYGMNNALKSLFDTYILFNISYSTKEKPFGLSYLGGMAQISGMLFLILMIIGIVIDIKTKTIKPQMCVFTAASIIVICFVLSPIMTFAYTLIVLMPILLFGINRIVDLVINLVKDDKTVMQLSVIIAVVMCINMGYQMLYIFPSSGSDNSEYEQRLKYFTELHPQAEFMFFECLCQPLCYDLTDGLPSFRVFYLPPMATDSIVAEQLIAIKDGKPDAVVFPYNNLYGEPYDSFAEYVKANGYSLYAVYVSDSESGKLLFVRQDDAVFVT